MKKSRLALALTGVLAAALLSSPAGASATSPPSGETMLGNSSTEPAIDYANGNLIFLHTPLGSAAHINPQFAHNVAPLYLPVYPVSAAGTVGTLNCEDTVASLGTVENCPDHGPKIAAAAMSVFPSVYGGGVYGHDHLVGVAKTGGDFNVLWEPIALLWMPGAPITHLTTLTQIQTALAANQLLPIPLESATFPCSVVSSAVYYRGTPVS